MPADHRRPAGVNRDASLFCRARGSGLAARRDDGARSGYFGSAVRRTGPRCAGRAERSPRHNKSDPGRSSCRSRSAFDSPRRETTALTLPRHETPMVDERHDCQDIGSAYVPGTVWGTASSQTAKFRSRRRACLLIPAKLPRTAWPGSQPDQQNSNLDSGKPIFSSESRARLTPLCPAGSTLAKTTRPISRAVWTRILAAIDRQPPGHARGGQNCRRHGREAGRSATRPWSARQ